MNLNLLNKTISLFSNYKTMMQIDNNYNLTDDEFFASHPQPSLLSCVYQVEPRPAPDVAKKMMQQLTNVNPNALTSEEIDAAIASLKANIKDGETWTPTEEPAGAPDLSEYILSDQEMQAASDRLNQINKDALQQKELHTLLEQYFQSDRAIYDTELDIYFPIME